jgi:hypothetical protein
LGLTGTVPREDDPLVLGGLQVNEMFSPAYFDVAKRWLAECVKTHPECGNDVPGLPSRVMCVSEDGQDPHLMSGEGKFAHYATRSHCWGLSNAGMTTSENQLRHQNAIPRDAFPKTFRDAIAVSRKLGIRCLWIDRLCIVQDSKADWEHQSGTMGSIYNNSTLVLAATASSESLTGLFMPKSHCDY